MNEDELTLGVPEGQPEQAPQPEAPGTQEYIDLKNRDESWRVPKDLFQQFADTIGWDVNRLKDSLEIGSDGRQLYGRIDEERERLAAEARQIQAVREQYERAQQQYRQPQYPGQYQAPSQPQGPRPRPPSEDVTGNVLWAAEMLERMTPYLERIPEVERNQSYINQSIRQRDEEIATAEERASALRAYQETAETWKKEYGVEPPPQRELEAFLRRFPISDDVDATWGEVWDRAAWMLKGPAVFRQARRNAVLEAQKPDARITVPVSRAGMGSSPAPRVGQLGPNPSQEQLDQQFAEMTKMLGGG